MKNRNENKPGYKNTALGWVPEQWEIRTLGSITEMSQYGLSTCASEKGEIPLLRMVNIEGGKVTYNNLVYIDIPGSEQSKYLVEKYDLLFNRTNSLDHVGKMGIVTNPRAAVFASYIVRFQLNTSVAFPPFVNYFFNTPESRSRLKKLATPGVSQYNINQSELKRSFLITLPPLLEQRKISETLTIWDEAIEKAHELIKAKERHKTALIQQLLTGRQRLKNAVGDEWRVRVLGELVEPILRQEPKPQKPYLSIGIRSHGKGTFHKIVEFPEKVSMDTLYRVEPEDLIVNITFAWEGAVAIAKEQDRGGLVSHRFPTYRLKEKEMNIDFFSNLIQTKKFVFNLGLISPGGAGRNRVLNQKDFLKLKVSVPSPENQTEIAGILKAADDEIRLLERYLDALKRQKAGLIQKLMTGDVRVRT